jgi:nucleotide-binding universal stress UspA family protein
VRPRGRSGHPAASGQGPSTALQGLEELARRLAPGIDIGVRVLDGRPGPLLLAESEHASCLVIGAPARRLLGPAPGSSSDFLPRHVRCPLVVVRGTAPDTAGVVVGVDGSLASRDALGFAARAAVDRGVSLLVAHIWSPGADDASSGEELGGTTIEGLTTGMLQADIDLVCRRSPQLEVRLVSRRGSPARELARLAESAQLLVVGSHCRGAIGAAVFGSVAASLVRRSACPVAVVRPHAVTDGFHLNPAERSIA